MNQKISQLPAVTTATGTELIPVVQAGTTKQATLAQLLAVLVAGAPAALDTLKEIADAFGDDPNYAADIVTQLAAKADAASVAATYATLAAAATLWKANTAYGAGQPVINPSGQLVLALAAFTSGSSYDSTKWSVPAAGGGAAIDDTTTSTSKVWSSSKTSTSFAKRILAATYDASTHANGTVTAMDTGQTVLNFGAAPATVSSGVIVNTPTGSSPTAAYQQIDLGAKIGRVGATFELNGSEIVTLVVPSTTWTDGNGNMTTFNPAAAHFGITQTSWSYGIWTGSGQTILATGYLNLTNGVPYDVDLYFDGTTAYIAFSDGTFATVTDSRISTYRSSFAIWELYSNTSSDTGAKLHKLWADIDGSAAASSATDIARARSRTLATLAAQTVVADEFLGGTTTSGSIGELGWTSLGGGISRVNAQAGHPGVVELTTGTTSGTLSALYLPGTVLGSELWDLTYWVNLNNVDSSTKIRIGWTSDATADVPAVAAYFEKLTTDTNWFAAPRVANLTGPRSDMGVAATTGWHKFRIRQAQSLNFLFSIDGGTEVDVTQYLAGSSERILPMVQITNSAAAAKTIDIDRVSLTINGLTR